PLARGRISGARERGEAGLPRRAVVDAGPSLDVLERPRLGQDPREAVAGLVRHAVHRHAAPERDAAIEPRDRHVGVVAELLEEYGLEIGRGDAPALELAAVAVFAQKRFAPERAPGVQHRLLERHRFERVQRVVMDEHADGPLRGQDLGDFLDVVGQRHGHRAAPCVRCSSNACAAVRRDETSRSGSNPAATRNTAKAPNTRSSWESSGFMLPVTRRPQKNEKYIRSTVNPVRAEATTTANPSNGNAPTVPWTSNS